MTNDLAWHLKELPVMQGQKIKDWLEAMSNSQELYILMCTINEPGNRERVFKLLKNKNVYLNSRSYSGEQTPLIEAIYMEDGEIVAALLAAGADPDSKDDLEWTALMLAANKGLTEIAKLLIAAHANVNIQDAVGYSPLILAASHGHQEIVESLLAAGSDPELRSFKDNKSAEDFAREGNHSLVAKILAEASAKRLKGHIKVECTAEKK
jgi:ankyrin repeat protein